MSKLSCVFGFHNYEVYKELDLTDCYGNVLGKRIISRCSNCGRIKIDTVHTINMN